MLFSNFPITPTLLALSGQKRVSSLASFPSFEMIILKTARFKHLGVLSTSRQEFEKLKFEVGAPLQSHLGEVHALYNGLQRIVVPFA